MVYSVEEKGVNPLTLGAMSTAYALVGILSAIPLGKLADRIGWVRTVILIRPLFHISTLILLFTPDPRWIILGWALRGTLPAEFEHPRGLPERAGVPLGAWEMDGDPGAPPGDLQDTRAHNWGNTLRSGLAAGPVPLPHVRGRLPQDTPAPHDA